MMRHWPFYYAILQLLMAPIRNLPHQQRYLCTYTETDPVAKSCAQGFVGLFQIRAKEQHGEEMNAVLLSGSEWERCWEKDVKRADSKLTSFSFSKRFFFFFLKNSSTSTTSTHTYTHREIWFFIYFI